MIDQDSPLGVRFADFITGFPTGVNAAATFNRRLIRARGTGMGQEHFGKGVNVALGPMMNLGRVAAGGRNWEGFGADPYLAGEVAYETILGIQQTGVQASAKHLVNKQVQALGCAKTHTDPNLVSKSTSERPRAQTLMIGLNMRSIPIHS